MISKKVFLIFMWVHMISFAVGIESLNFYQDKKEKVLYQSYVEYENKGGKYEYIKWKLGTGSAQLNKEWTFDYDIERKFENIRDIKGWENTFALYKKLETKELLGKTWYTNLGPYIKYDMSKIPKGEDFKENKYGIRYRVRTNSDIGLGNAYWGVDFITSYVDTNKKDGVLFEANLTGSATLGYGFQDFFTIYNEYLDYKEHKGAYLLRIENLFRWTYDFNENFAISLENEIDSYNYFGNTKEKSSLKVNIGPYILFNKNFNDNFKIFAKVGILGVNYEDYKSDNFKMSEKGYYAKVKVGIEYIF